MKKIYKCQGYASFNNEKWYPLGKSTRLIYLEEPESMITKHISFNNFDSAYNYLKEHKLVSCHMGTTAFNHPIIWFDEGDVCFRKGLNKKNFKPIAEKWQLEEVTDYTFLNLMNYMDADNFIEYCKDKGFGNLSHELNEKDIVSDCQILKNSLNEKKMKENFNPIYDSEFRIIIQDMKEQPKLSLVELPYDMLLNLRNEINYILKQAGIE